MPASEVEKWEVKPGNKVVMTVKAEDLCTFPKPNIGSGEEKQFDVVSPEQLRAILEGRESSCGNASRRSATGRGDARPALEDQVLRIGRCGAAE